MRTEAPYRVSLFGGGTDYPEWYQENGGIAVNFTIQECIRVELREEEDELTRGVLLREGVGGMRVVTDADLPRESGMGGSAAYAVALLAAAKGRVGDRLDLAEEAYRAEKGVGRTVGRQDHLAAAMGGFNTFVFIRGKKLGSEVAVVPIGLRREEVEDFCKRLVLLRVPRMGNGSEIAKGYAKGNREAVSNIAREGVVALESRDWEMVGRLLRVAWEEKRGWGAGVTNPVVDQMVMLAMACGAWGTKLCGAGGGGYVLAVAENGRELWEKVTDRDSSVEARWVRYREKGVEVK